ncbi:hypothetical protein GCM10027037_06120 [Mucilaginibacter koreensis]
MKKALIAAAIILTSGVTALSVTKKSTAAKPPVNASTLKADFAERSTSSAKSDLGTIQ